MELSSAEQQNEAETQYNIISYLANNQQWSKCLQMQHEILDDQLYNFCVAKQKHRFRVNATSVTRDAELTPSNSIMKKAYYLCCSI
jgi:hypothetical protein